MIEFNYPKSTEFNKTLRNDYRKVKHQFRKAIASQNLTFNWKPQHRTNSYSLEQLLKSSVLSDIVLKNVMCQKLLVIFLTSCESSLFSPFFI